MARYLAVLILAFLGVSCQAQEGVVHINVDQAVKLIENGATIIDVRTDREYQDGHLQNSNHIPIASADFLELLNKLPKDKEYVVYCYVGGRSSKAARKMVELGFGNVYNLGGGIKAWMKANQSVVKP